MARGPFAMGSPGPCSLLSPDFPETTGHRADPRGWRQLSLPRLCLQALGPLGRPRKQALEPGLGRSPRRRPCWSPKVLSFSCELWRAAPRRSCAGPGGWWALSLTRNELLGKHPQEPGRALSTGHAAPVHRQDHFPLSQLLCSPLDLHVLIQCSPMKERPSALLS